MTGTGLDTLGAIEATIWQQLALCVATSRTWRTPVLATIDGERADARTVVLREIDERQRALLISPTSARRQRCTSSRRRTARW